MNRTKTEDCTFKCQTAFNDLLLALKDRFQQHFLVLFQSNLDVQKNIIDSMWVISQRFLILTSSKLAASSEYLKQKCRVFDKVLENIIDPSLPSQIINGCKERKPIYYYIELFADFLKFFNDFHKQLKLLGNCLNVDDIKSILEYKNKLDPDKTEMDYFEKSMCEIK